jgi:hypothetical protein
VSSAGSGGQGAGVTARELAAADLQGLRAPLPSGAVQSLKRLLGRT